MNDLFVSTFVDRRDVTSFCLGCGFVTVLFVSVFVDLRLVTSFCPDCGFVTDPLVIVFDDRRFVPLLTDCLSEIDRGSDLRVVLLIEEPLKALLS